MPNIIETPAANADILCRKLNSFGMVQTILDEDENVFPLTGVAIKLTVWESDGSELLVFEDGAGVTVDIDEGTISFAKTADEMDLAPGKYKYNMTLTFPNGDVVTWIVGKFYIKDLAE
jgi:hypothetical protein